MKGLPSSRDTWKGIDYTDALRRAKRRCWTVMTILFVIELVISTYIFFHLSRPPGVSPTDYAMAVMSGLGVPLIYNFSILRFIGDDSDLSPPSAIVNGRIAPFAVAANWLFIVVMVFPVGIFAHPPWGVLLTNPSPFTLIGFAFIGFIVSMRVFAYGWIAFNALRMKFDPKFRAKAERLSKAMEDHR